MFGSTLVPAECQQGCLRRLGPSDCQDNCQPAEDRSVVRAPTLFLKRKKRRCSRWAPRTHHTPSVNRLSISLQIIGRIKREAGAGGKTASLRDPARRDKRDHSGLFVGQSDRRTYALIFFKRNRRTSRQDDFPSAQKFISAPIPT